MNAGDPLLPQRVNSWPRSDTCICYNWTYILPKTKPIGSEMVRAALRKTAVTTKVHLAERRLKQGRGLELTS